VYTRIVFCLCTVLLAFTATATAQDSVQTRFNYQGVLLDGVGNPVTTPVSIRWSYYADATSVTPVFAETLLVTPDNQGRFSEVDSNKHTKSVSNLGNAGVVGIGVGNDPEMTPRIRLGAAPFALWAHGVRGGNIQVSPGLFVMTSAAGDTTVKIDSAGNAHFVGQVKSGNSLILDGPNDRLLTDDGQMYFGRSSPGVFSDIEVGIGTQSPTATLHVEGTTYLNGVAKIASGQRLQSAAAGGARILGEQGGTAATPAIGFFSTNGVDDGGGGNGIYRPAANAMAFAVQSTEKMRISGFGVGVGTTSPTSVLHVNGPIATAIATVGGSVTLLSTASVVLADNSGPIDVTLPPASTCAGRQVTVKKISLAAGAVTVNGNATESDLIDGETFQTLTNQYDFFVMVSDGDNWYIVGK
jgi:hypothetical protein